MIKYVMAAVLGASMLTGCSYSGAAMVGTDRVVITKDGLAGLIRAVYVCKVTEGGLTDCNAADAP
jgi:hypothetical protein